MPSIPPDTDERPATSPWLTVREAAARLHVSVDSIYSACRTDGPRRLRHARLAGRRDIRLRAEWIDSWLEASSTPVEVDR